MRSLLARFLFRSESLRHMEDKAAERRARKAAAARARRQNPEVRAREAEAARRRRETDPDVRAREAEGARRRREADPETVRAREAARKRAYRRADPEAARAREAAAKRLKRALPEGADARFKRDFLDNSFGHSCNVCDRLWFANNNWLIQHMACRYALTCTSFDYLKPTTIRGTCIDIAFTNVQLQPIQEPLSLHFTDHKAVIWKGQRKPNLI